jgi:hypothetical protein
VLSVDLIDLSIINIALKRLAETAQLVYILVVVSSLIRSIYGGINLKLVPSSLSSISGRYSLTLYADMYSTLWS